MLRSRLVTLQAKLPTLLIASLDPVVLFSTRFVFCFCLLRRSLRFQDPFLRTQSGLLPLLTAPLNIGREFIKIISHLLQRHGKLKSVVRHAVVETIEFIVILTVSTLAVLVAISGVVKGTRELAQALRMLFLQR